MADKKISQLTDGTSLQSGDFVVVARSGDNFKVDPTQFGSDISLGDNVKATFGDSSDLQIYHDGFHSYIEDAGTGQLRLQSDIVALRTSNGETSVTATQDAGVSIRHNNIEKLATTATGIDVTGTVTATGVDIFSSQSSRLRIRNAVNNAPTVNHLELLNNADEGLKIAIPRSGATSIASIYYDQGIVFNEGGVDADFRVESDSNTHMLFVDAGNDRVGIGTGSPATALDVNGDATIQGDKNETLQLKSTNTSTVGWSGSSSDRSTGRIEWYGSSPAGDGAGIKAVIDTEATSNTGRDFDLLIKNSNNVGSGEPTLSLRIDASKDISFYEATGTTAKFFWDASEERLGLGTTSPATALDVNGTITADGLTVSSGGTFTNQNGVTLNLERNDTNLGDGDFISGLRFGNNDSSGTPPHGTGIKVTADSTFGAMFLDILSGDRNAWDDSNKAIRVSPTVTSFYQFVVFNEDGADVDFRVESDNNANMLFVDAGNDSVGVGTDTPFGNAVLTVTDNTDNFQAVTVIGEYDNSEYISIGIGGAGEARITAGGSGSTSTALTFHTSSSGTEAEAARITSSGILLVGTTDTTNTTLGCKIAVDGTTIVHTDASGFSQPLLLNRQDSDGTLLTFRQANSTVGSIGTTTDNGYFIMLDASNRGFALRTVGGETALQPSTTTAQDGYGSLGSSGARWKDLYLSGGVYLGGTAAANLLDDYEEGTWTPEAADANTGGNTAAGYSEQYGWYVKIGNRVFVAWRLQGIDTTGMTAGNQLYIRGLPEAMANPSPSGQVFVGAASTANVVIDNGVNSFINANTIATGFRLSTSTGAGVFRNIIVSNLTSGTADIFGQFFYFV